MPARPLLIIDGDSLAHRAYHGLPKTISRRGGGGAGALLGFANMLLRLCESERPRAVVVGWDSLDAATYRHRALPAYQSGRVFDRDLLEQLDLLPSFVAACGFVNGKAAGYEADDFLATAVAREARRNGACLVVSSDRDTFQLASDRTTILQPVKGGEWLRIGPDEVRARYGVEPDQVPDFIALRGDPSDRLPGARGIGPVTAAAMIRKYGGLEQILAHGRLQGQEEDLRLYKHIATMDANAPLPAIRRQVPKWRRGAELARSWGLDALADRLANMQGAEPRRSRAH